MPVTQEGYYSIPSTSQVYLQACSVCKRMFSGRRDWLNHLTQVNHQTLAKEECLKIWDSDSRKSCLVVFTTKSLTKKNSVDILEYFSGQHIKGDCVAMVTDFIWWKDRPKIGILQFESREKAKQILKSSGHKNSQRIQIGDFQWVQVKHGAKLQELEWDAIRPQVKSTDENGISLNKKRKLDKMFCQETGGSKSSRAIQLSQIIHPEKSPPSPITATSHPFQFQFWNVLNNLPFQVIPQTNTLMEVQVCRLLEYLCQFDPRCEPLIQLATYWVNLNSINISGNTDAKNQLQLPSHCTIQWLVIVFLCYKKYLPTPREILKSGLQDDVTRTNIIFQCDPTFVEEWKLQKWKNMNSTDKMSEEFILNVLHLFGDFMTYTVSTFGGRGLEKVINTRDGKSISVNALLQTNSSNMYQSKRSSYWQNPMTPDEIQTLKTAVKREKTSKEFCGVYMTHPFLFSHKFSLASDTKHALKQFGVGYGKFMTFLSQVKKNGLQVSLEEVGGLKNLCTIVKKG